MNWTDYKKTISKLSNKEKGDSFEELVKHYLGHTKVTTTQIYADFEDTVDIANEFPSIMKPSSKPIFGIKDTIMKDTNAVY